MAAAPAGDLLFVEHAGTSGERDETARGWGAAFVGMVVNASPAAARDNFCGAVEMLIDLAYEDFAPIDDGPTDPAVQPTAGSTTLPAAEGCEILPGDVHPGYWCSWASAPHLVRVQTHALADRIGACLGQDPDWVYTNGAVSAFIVDRGVEFYVSGSNLGHLNEITLSVEFIGDDDDPEGGEPLQMLVRGPEPSQSDTAAG